MELVLLLAEWQASQLAALRVHSALNLLSVLAPPARLPVLLSQGSVAVLESGPRWPGDWEEPSLELQVAVRRARLLVLVSPELSLVRFVVGRLQHEHPG
jgi:hypothetical protein